MMIDMIAEKFITISHCKPFPTEIQKYLKESCVAEWIWSSLRIEGSLVRRQQVADMLQGELVKDVSLGEYAAVDRYWNLFPFIYNLLNMETELDLSVTKQLYDHLDPDNSGYRRSNPILRQWDYNPPHFKDVEEKMQELFHWYGNASYPGNPLMKGVVLHNRLLEIYPFGDDSGMMARLTLLYHLMDNGLYPFVLTISETEYNKAMIKYLKDRDSSSLYHAVEKGVYNRLEILEQMLGAI